MAVSEQSAKGSAKLLQIGEVADRVGLSLRTMRYYEEVGLLEPDERTAGGFRLYGEDQIERLSLIKRMKPLGLKISEIREVLDALDAAQSGKRGSGGGARKELIRYAELADERCERLKRELKAARSVARQLRHEAGGD